MMAACSAAYHGASVVLLEKKDRLGRKLSITGKGRCNLTSSLDLDQFVQGYAGNGRFLYSALHAFSNQDLMDFFRSRGLQLNVERGQRVFPVSDPAHDVVQILEQELHRLKIEVITEARVDSLKPGLGIYHKVWFRTVSGCPSDSGYRGSVLSWNRLDW